MLTRLLNLHGVILAGDLTKPNEFNERGYWESLEVQLLNDRIFNNIQTVWFDCFETHLSTMSKEETASFKNKILSLLRENFSDLECALFAIKDPRLSKISPLWQEALASFGAKVAIIIPFRNPLEVADSLERRDALTGQYSLLLWLRHMLDSERYSRGMNRAFVSFDGLLIDWKFCMARLAEELKIKWPIQSSAVEKPVKEFISHSLKHYNHTDTELVGFGLIGELTLKVLTLLRRMELEPYNVNFTREFDNLYEEVGRILKKPISDVPTVVKRHVAHQRHLSLLGAEESKITELEMTVKFSSLNQVLRIHELEVMVEKQRENAAQTQFAEVSKTEKSKAKLSGQLRKAEANNIEKNDALLARGSELREFEKKFKIQKNELKQEQKQTAELENALKITQENHNSELARFKEAQEKLNVQLDASTVELEFRRQEIVSHEFQQALQSRKFIHVQSRLDEQNHDIQKQNAQLAEKNATVLNLIQTIDQLENVNKNRAAHTRKQVEAIAALTRKLEGFRQPRFHRLHTMLQPIFGKVRSGVTLLKTKRTSKFIRKSQYFDPDWYLQQYPDVLAGGMDPVEHYLLHGAGENRKPNPDFDTYGYFLANPDVALAKINPLVHYIKFRRKEGRRSTHGGN